MINMNLSSDGEELVIPLDSIPFSVGYPNLSLLYQKQIIKPKIKRIELILLL